MCERFWVFEYPTPIVYEPGKTSALVKVYEGDAGTWMTWPCPGDMPPTPWVCLRRVLHRQTVMSKRCVLNDVAGDPVKIERFALIRRGIHAP